MANARLAEESYRYRDAKGEMKARTTWHSIVLYDELAALAETFREGENVRIVGALLSRQFTPKDGSRARTVWEVVAQEAYVIAPARARVQRVDGEPNADAEDAPPAESRTQQESVATPPVAVSRERAPLPTPIPATAPPGDLLGADPAQRYV